MARARNAFSIDEKITKAKETVERSKKKYDAAVADLKNLVEKKNEMKRAELMDAIEKSGKSYEEILAFIRNDNLSE